MPFPTLTVPTTGDATKTSLVQSIINALNYLNIQSQPDRGGLIVNNGFETDADSDGDPDGWDFTDYSGGSHAINTSNESAGVNALAFTSTVLANGGGYCDSEDFFVVTGSQVYPWRLRRHASTTGVSCQYQVTWYDDTQTSISTSTLFQDTSAPTSATMTSGWVQSPATARYAKVRLEGGVPATGSATGTVYFDSVYFSSTMYGWQARSLGTFSSDANLEIDLSEHSHHKITFFNVKPSGDNSAIYAEISDDNASTWETSNYKGNRTDIDVGTSTAGTSGTSNILMIKSNAMGTTGSPRGWTGEVTIIGADQSGCQIHWWFSGEEFTSGDQVYSFGSAFYDSANNPTDIRFDTGGNFASGSYFHEVK